MRHHNVADDAVNFIPMCGYKVHGFIDSACVVNFVPAGAQIGNVIFQVIKIIINEQDHSSLRIFVLLGGKTPNPVVFRLLDKRISPPMWGMSCRLLASPKPVPRTRFTASGVRNPSSKIFSSSPC